MRHPDRPAVVVAAEAIATLQQRVLAWMDADRVLPADGSSLLALLERTLEELTRENAAAARAGIEAFTGRVEALVEAGLLEAADGHSRLAASAALADAEEAILAAVGEPEQLQLLPSEWFTAL